VQRRFRAKAAHRDDARVRRATRMRLFGSARLTSFQRASSIPMWLENNTNAVV
jgi:hypothetical protein